ncbi:GMC family oxidoreductase N-terminal domain-containing protein [Gordonia rubripertincta]|uniref:GMC family oxidoreductase N-terminal domain-containing protein n=1 Tax=Gordonia rubripertincta TaxID=36822 RepID=UPI001FD15282|nr:GMC family oxidoreductase N-terminal domain-containing protein [Gordonia rubripertincta]
MPELGLRGFFWQRVLRHVGIIGGAGVGGGSIVWAGVLLEPKEEFFTDPAWPEVADGWRAQLTEHYRTAARMLGRETTRFVGEMDRHLETTAEKMGAGQAYGPTPMAIWFGAPGEEGVTVPDPFFGGEGPDRTGCRLCGACLIGCPYGSKNTLDLNYLWLAERRGVRIRPDTRVETVAAMPEGGYEVHTADGEVLRAAEVVLAAGVLGTVESCSAPASRGCCRTSRPDWVTGCAPTRRPSPRFWPTIRTPISPEARPSPASSIRTRPRTSPRTGTSAAGTCGCNSARWSTVTFPPGGGARRWRSSAATRSGSSG